LLVNTKFKKVKERGSKARRCTRQAEEDGEWARVKKRQGRLERLAAEKPRERNSREKPGNREETSLTEEARFETTI